MKSIITVIIIQIAAVSALSAGPVQIKMNGLTLNGELQQGEGKKLSEGVILITHGTLGHHKMETITSLQALLTEKGFNSLAITLSLSESNRSGMYDCNSVHRHKLDDSSKEISAWISWLKSKGAKDIVLLGHSRGGNQTALFAAENDSSSIKKVVLIAPGIFGDEVEKEYDQTHGKYESKILKAKGLVQSKKGDTVMKGAGILYCKGADATAESFYSYYGKENRKPTHILLKKIKKPVLVVFGSEDTLVPDSPKFINPIADGKKIKVKTVGGADHFFRDIFSYELADSVEEFLN